MILLTNDDGIDAAGIWAVYKELKKMDSVTVVAPDSEMSAIGHAITMSDPLRVKKHFKNGKFFGYAVNGTPADCVKIAVASLLKRKPALTVSGINFGSNFGTNIIYSGTVSAATESLILGIPAIASSLASYEEYDFSVAAKFTAKLAKETLEKGLPERVLLNVNVPALPAKRIKGVRVTRQGFAAFDDYYKKNVDPRGKTYYWLCAEKLRGCSEKGTDGEAVVNGYISVTPVHYDMTYKEYMGDLKKWRNCRW